MPTKDDHHFELTSLPDTLNPSTPEIPETIRNLLEPESEAKSKLKEEIQVYYFPKMNTPSKKKEEEEGLLAIVGQPGEMVVATISDGTGKLLAYSISVDGVEGNVHDVSDLNINCQDFMDEINTALKTAKAGAAKDIAEGKEPRNVFAETKDSIEAKFPGKELNMSFDAYRKLPISVKQDEPQEENASSRRSKP